MRLQLTPVVLVASLALAGTARAGGTFEFNMGGGLVYVKPDEGDTKIEGGSSQPHFSVGGKLSRKLGVVGRFGLFFPPDQHYFFFGGGVQYWFVKRLFVAAGIGYWQRGFEKPFIDEEGRSVEAYGGFAGDFRIGGTLYGDSHRLTLQVEALPAIYPYDFSVGILFLAGYQYW